MGDMLEILHKKFEAVIQKMSLTILSMLEQMRRRKSPQRNRRHRNLNGYFRTEIHNY